MDQNTITLRPWRETDLENLLKYANNANIATNLTNGFPHPYPREKGEEMIAKVTKADQPNILAITINDEFIGSIGLHFQQDIFFRNAELGYWVAEPFWGRGIATSAIKQITAYGFEHWPHLDRVFARPFGSNIGSQRALEKAGFLLEARLKGTIYKNDRVEDELIYAARRG
ncbi:MAG: GNAT family N-acetyltransferase [Bacteroidia bacterium]|jgi:RimJ/RimL family protein N-acetyltransferase|nr:GNAT family N-acetyltransferase [Bacteroidia bacterium]